ncbi:MULTISPECIES: hypothetical protein [unclassified Alteromonas]|uniref:hypothetical protein n=1 Tax=unclassified Alteromonas TaxID=2614992 RepID=UPI0005094202|nr:MULTISPECIES: hypothetical protein [unclassified Alteromonas]
MSKKLIGSIALASSCFLTSLGSNATILTLDGQTNAGNNLTEITDPSAPAGNGAWSASTLGDAGSFSDYWLYFDDDTSSTEYTLGNLLSVSFDTKKPLAGEQNDFFLQIYTTTDGIADGARWYGQRVTFDPRYAANLNAPADTWNSWSTSGTENVLAIYDSAGGFFGGYSGPTLAQLLDPSYQDDGNYSNSIVDYASEQVRGIRIATGTGWASSFEGAIDNISLDFGNDGTLNFDLEATQVSAPANLGLFGLFAAFIACSRRFLVK